MNVVKRKFHERSAEMRDYCVNRAVQAYQMAQVTAIGAVPTVTAQKQQNINPKMAQKLLKLQVD